MTRFRVLFVCMGNICRSPTAQGVFETALAEAGLSHLVQVDSAGTHGYHVGSAPDQRARQAALRRGVDLADQRSRRVSVEDFVAFDYVIAMDADNLNDLRELCPPEQAHKLSLFMHYGSDGGSDEVPDPYYGGPNGFERVLDLIEDASRGLLAHVQTRL